MVKKTGAEFVAFLQSVGAASACPICTVNRWAAQTADGAAVELGPLILTPEGRAIKPIPHYIMTCMNCGFTRMHASFVVEGQVEKKEEEGEKKNA
jgi:hypothetical protein